MDYSKIKLSLMKIKKIQFSRGVTEDQIREIEEDLNVTLPDSYKWF